MEKFGLLGEKLGHSYSPQIHAMLADYEYILYEKKPEEITEFLTNGQFNGLNVTTPYKKTVIPYCATLSEIAARLGSVNTLIKQKDGTLRGDNTDYFGFLYMLEKTGIDVKGKKALVLGDGGAAPTIRAALSDRGAGEVVTISRRGPDNYGNIGRHADARIIVNTTPVGMYPGNGRSPVELGDFKRCEAVADIIGNPAKTELMLQAEDRGIPCAGGLNMLVAQAKRACELFRSVAIQDTVIEEIVEAIGRSTRNIALIGMPGCGKTTVGQQLAEITGRRFFDVDEIIIAIAGKSIGRIFDEDGEAVFRDLEEEALRTAAKEWGSVISTGGGVVGRESNRRLLRQNSDVVFLDRALGELPDMGRPLSLTQGAEALYERRLPLYLAWSDYRVTACDGVMQTAQAVKEALRI